LVVIIVIYAFCDTVAEAYSQQSYEFLVL